MTTFLTYLPVIKDIVTILATATAAIVAVIGLQTWRKQIRGNEEYDLARRVLIAVYKVRDEISQYLVRVAMEVSVGELQTALGNEIRHDGTARGKHVTKMYLAKEKLDIELLEAEAVWGQEKDFKAIFERVHNLCEFIRLDNITRNLPNQFVATETGDLKEVAIRPYDERLETDLRKTVKEIEDFLRPKLMLKQGRKSHRWRLFGRKQKS